MFKKLNEVFIIAIFAIAITLPLVFADKAGGGRSNTENRYYAKFPSIITADGKLARGISAGFDSWITDNAGFRSQAQFIRAAIDTQIFKVSPNQKVQLGKDGWYFYTGDKNLEIGKGEYFLAEKDLKSVLRKLQGAQKFLTERGIEFIFIVIPSKASVYPEYISGGQYSVQDTLIDDLADYLSENSTINIINLKDSLVEAKKSQLVYFKTDTHWNYDGQYIGYKNIIDELNRLGMIDSKPVSVASYQTDALYGLSSMAGKTISEDNEPVTGYQPASPKAMRLESGPHYQRMVGLSGYEVEKTWYQYYQNDAVEDKKALVFSDSFFVVGDMRPLLAEHFSEVDFLNFRNANREIILESQPDLVIFELSERFLYVLTDPNYLILN